MRRYIIWVPLVVVLLTAPVDFAEKWMPKAFGAEWFAAH